MEEKSVRVAKLTYPEGGDEHWGELGATITSMQWLVLSINLLITGAGRLVTGSHNKHFGHVKLFVPG